MTNTDSDLVFGWKSGAVLAGCSERYLRDLAAERNLVAARRPDGAVALRRADLLGLAEELRRDRTHDEPACADGYLPAAGADGHQPGGTAGPVVASSAPAAPLASPAVCIDEPVRPAGAAGEIAAIVFADLRDGKNLTDIVAARALAPEMVLALYRRWRELRAVDDLHTQAAEDRLAMLEARAREQDELIRRQGEASTRLQSGLGLAWEAVSNLGEPIAQVRADLGRLAGRLAAVEKRAASGNLMGTVLDLGQRLAGIEATIRAWSTPHPTPMPPMLAPPPRW